MLSDYLRVRDNHESTAFFEGQTALNIIKKTKKNKRDCPGLWVDLDQMWLPLI
jgi:hypothetical protein